MVSGGRDGQRSEKQASLSPSEFYATECGTLASARCGGCMCTRALRERTISVVTPFIAPVSPTSSLFLRPRPSPSHLLPSFRPSSHGALSTFKLDFKLTQSSQLSGQDENCHRYGVHMFRFVLVPGLSISGLHLHPPPFHWPSCETQQTPCFLAEDPCRVEHQVFGDHSHSPCAPRPCGLIL